MDSADKLKTFLSKVFLLEAQKGFENNAVMGGFGKYAENWPAQAREAGVAEPTLRRVSDMLRTYADGDVSSRRNLLAAMGSLLALPGMEALPQPKQAALPIETKPARKGRTSSKAKTTASQESPLEGAARTKRPKRAKAEKKTAPVSNPIARNLVSEQVEGLDASVSVIRGVGEKQARNLQKLGIAQVRDLLYHFPRRYVDYSQLKPIASLRYGEEVTIVANVVEARLLPLRSGKKMVEAVVSDQTGSLRLLWFNQEWVLRSLRKDMLLSISGRVESFMGRPVIYHPDFESIERETLNTNRIVPVYPLTALVTQKWLRRMVYNTVGYWSNKVQDFMPEAVLDQAEAISLGEALRQIHFPDDLASLKAAQRRLAFDEIFLLQLGVTRQRLAWQELEGRAYTVSDAWVRQRFANLPYELTKAQKQAFEDIRGDLNSPHPMNRLLQGDVGSGKTVVAVLGMSIVIASGAQAALMAPTSILAEQHYRSVSRLMSESIGGGEALLEADQVRLLTGDTPAAERKAIAKGLKEGRVKLLIGTHALIEDPVIFDDLQMIVVDEQHRFGVEQRAALRAKGENPHLLVMTATPIPRSLQLTIFGDLSVSVMDEMPAGRLPVSTAIVFPAERPRVYRMIEKQVAEGHQAFIIYPLVEQGDNEDTRAAVDEQQRLQRDIFPHLRVGLVHGRLRPAEKDAVMLAFREKEYDILVSTSVVEVGVDIPNATMMVIEGANRFGLAQLHQFRGRVGRGDAQAFCILIPDNDDAAENERLQVMTQTNDGFVLAEKDLEQRGPGDFLGKRQAGFADLKLASLTDLRMLQLARNIAGNVLGDDPELRSPENRALRRAVENFWPSVYGTGDVS